MIKEGRCGLVAWNATDLDHLDSLPSSFPDVRGNG